MSTGDKFYELDTLGGRVFHAAFAKLSASPADTTDLRQCPGPLPQQALAMLEGLYLMNRHPPLSNASNLQSTVAAAAAVLAAVSQPQQAQQQQQQDAARLAHLQQQLAAPASLALRPPALAPSALGHMGDGPGGGAASSLDPLMRLGCSRREAEVAWDLLTLWRLMRSGCDPALGRYHLPLQRYTRQPALILRLQSCKSEKQLAKYVVRLVHAFRRTAARQAAAQAQAAPGGVPAPAQQRPSIEQGVQLMNKLLQLLAEAWEGAQPMAAAAAAGVPALHLGPPQQQQHHQHQQQFLVPTAPLDTGMLLPLMFPEGGEGPGLGAPMGGADLWGSEVVMGLPHAVLLDSPRHPQQQQQQQQLPHGEEPGGLGLARASSLHDFLGDLRR